MTVKANYTFTFEDCIKKCESIIDGIYQDGYQSIHLYSLKTFIYGMVDIHNKTTIELQDEVNQFRAIGTIEEFKALKEKNEPKKVAYQLDTWGYKHEKCPSCGSFHVFGKHCTECGQTVDYD